MYDIPMTYIIKAPSWEQLLLINIVHIYYVQYVHARICSIFREAEKRGIDKSPQVAEGKGSIEKEERDLMLKLSFFIDTMEIFTDKSTIAMLNIMISWYLPNSTMSFQISIG